MQQEALAICDRRQAFGKHTTGEGRWALPRELASASGSASSVPLARLPVRTRDELVSVRGHDTPLYTTPAAESRTASMRGAQDAFKLQCMSPQTSPLCRPGRLRADMTQDKFASPGAF